MKIEIEENYITVDGVKYIREAEIDNKTKLKASIWYKSLDYPKWMLCVTNIIFHEKRVKGYGFGADGNWMGNAQNDSWEFNEFDKCVEMSELEVFECLKSECVKRNIVEGNFIKELFKNNAGTTKYGFKLNQVSNEDFKYNSKNNVLFIGNLLVFDDGIWAEAFETITIQEAQEQLKKKIIL